MLIEKQPDGWSFTTEEQTGLWHLAYDDEKKVTAFFESTQTTSTGSNLFVGTKEECDQYIIDNGLIYASVVEDAPTEESFAEEAPTEESLAEEALS